MQRPMYDMLQAVSGRLSMHMPASQGQPLFEGISLYQTETTELPVTDDMFHPLGAILQAQRLLAESAHTKASFLLHGGSTAGVHAMLLYACLRGDTVILPRNVHLSALNLCAIAGIEPVFAELTQTPEGFVTVSSDAYKDALAKHPEAKAALAISSDYYGLLCDLPAIAALVHAHGKLLLCDEAHGAYFNWRTDVQNAGAQGADLFVQSAHKTLPSVNAAAWLHAMDGIDLDRLNTMLRMVQTSSPSFAVMQSMDDARTWMDAYGRNACDRLSAAMDDFRKNAAALGYTDDRKPYAADQLRLVLRAPQGGERLQRQLEEMKIDVEMSDTDHIVCIVSLLDGETRLRRLYEALQAIDRQPGNAQETRCSMKLLPSVWPQRQMPLSQAMFAETEIVYPRDAAGRISAANVGLYPPGAAWLTAGETVTPEIVEMIAQAPENRVFGVNGGIRCVK